MINSVLTLGLITGTVVAENQLAPGLSVMAARTATSRANRVVSNGLENSAFVTTAEQLQDPAFLQSYAQQHGDAATVALTQAWLKTYRITALTGINLLNTEYKGSVATFSGGLRAMNGRVTITNGQDATWGAIINGGVTIDNNQMFFQTVNLLTDRSIADQEMDYQNPRETGNGEIQGSQSGRQTVGVALSVTAMQRALQAVSNYYDQLLSSTAVFDVEAAYGHFQKDQIGTTGTKDLGTFGGQHYYVVNVDARHVANMQTSGFNSDDVLIYNDVSHAPSVTFSGGFTADGGQINWNFAASTTIHNSTTISGRIIAPNGVLLTNQNVDDANVLQYGAGYSNSAQATIVASSEQHYPINKTIQDDPLSFVQLVVTPDGQVITSQAALQQLVANGELKLTISSADGQHTYSSLNDVPTTTAGEHLFKVTYTIGTAHATTWITIDPDQGGGGESGSSSESSSSSSSDASSESSSSSSSSDASSESGSSSSDASSGSGRSSRAASS